jgi:hypothetical protein
MARALGKGEFFNLSLWKGKGPYFAPPARSYEGLSAMLRSQSQVGPALFF